ncbi:MAG: hypothetical protein LBO04_01275 [Spirochaetaceae bacterium]|jgi:hypothetical protein|nr:hypothetical protein [Spirochaetaceae bacterium]
MAEPDKKPERTPWEAAAVIEEVSVLKRSLPRVTKVLKKRLQAVKGRVSAGEGGRGEAAGVCGTGTETAGERGDYRAVFADASHFVT